MTGTADQQIRLNTNFPERPDAVLGRFGFKLSTGFQIGDDRNMDVHDVFPAQVQTKLADGLQERQRFNVSHRAADLTDHHVHIALQGQTHQGGLDLIRHVGNHLHRSAEIISPALLRYYRVVNSSGGNVVVLGEGFIQKAFIVAQVKIGLGPVIGNEHLTVLQRIHRSRINIQIRIELHDGHRKPTGFKEHTQGR
ncbi:MAG: hypothetical protein IID61_17705, partial [SAR324 cluster bacterium]|nr:hypothetical protein [SAR324 cluster bacterium]